jgi:transmembrane sensor
MEQKMDHDEKIHKLIVRLLAGEATTEEKHFIDDWLNQHSDNKKLFNELREIWLVTGIETNADEYKVDEAIREFLFKTRFLTANTSHRYGITRILQYAAILILALAIPVTYWFARESKPAEDSFTTIICPFGDKTNIYLPDSSQVWLNSGSKLTFSNNFTTGSRSLFLEGEAYFTVRKDEKNPFVIKTSALSVEVLGTEFNLKAYPDEAHAMVTLVTGSLMVKNNLHSSMVVPGQRLIYETESHEVTIENLSDLAPETEWINGRMVFRNQSLEELELKLERWFDVEIEFADELVKSRRFSGTLERESILEVISYFGISQYVDYRINGNIITFFSENHK